MVSPVKLAHVVLWTRRVPQMRDWYVKVLDGRVVYENPAGAFLTYDDEHHRIAVTDPVAAAKLAAELAGQSDGLVGAGGAMTSDISTEDLLALPLHGLSHIAFTYRTLEDLLGNYERLKEESTSPTMTINHGTTTSMYYADPDGNQVELQVDNFETAEEGVAFMMSESFAKNPVGVPFDPETFLKRLRAGERAADLVAPTW